jgi:hypothetical protein
MSVAVSVLAGDHLSPLCPIGGMEPFYSRIRWGNVLRAAAVFAVLSFAALWLTRPQSPPPASFAPAPLAQGSSHAGAGAQGQQTIAPSEPRLDNAAAAALAPLHAEPRRKNKPRNVKRDASKSKKTHVKTRQKKQRTTAKHPPRGQAEAPAAVSVSSPSSSPASPASVSAPVPASVPAPAPAERRRGPEIPATVDAASDPRPSLEFAP